MDEQSIQGLFLRLHHWLRSRNIPTEGLVIEIKAPTVDAAFRLRSATRDDFDGLAGPVAATPLADLKEATVHGIRLEITSPADRGAR